MPEQRAQVSVEARKERVGVGGGGRIGRGPGREDDVHTTPPVLTSSREILVVNRLGDEGEIAEQRATEHITHDNMTREMIYSLGTLERERETDRERESERKMLTLESA